MHAYLGGVPKRTRTLRGAKSTLYFHEIVQWIYAFSTLLVAKLGDSVWRMMREAIGSPFGRILLGATLTREELTFIDRWKTHPPGWAKGLSLNQPMASSLYVDDCLGQSFVLS